MGEVSTIGLDLAKSVFQAHGAEGSGAVIFRKKLRREQVLAFFARQPRCLVAMEACGGGHYWAREIASLGHRTRLIPPSCVKPFVKRQNERRRRRRSDLRGGAEADDAVRTTQERRGSRCGDGVQGS